MQNTRPTQADRILAVLRERRLADGPDGGWVNGQCFLREIMLSQYHARIWDLERRGIRIEHSTEKDPWGFLSYRLAEGPKGVERFRVDGGPGREPKVVERVVW
jgi:hypothetical protein